jgi:hypothetical protein
MTLELVLGLQAVMIIALGGLFWVSRSAAKTHTTLLLRLLEKLEGRVFAPVPKSHIVSQPPVAIPPDPNIHEVLHRHDKDWAHGGWVRAHTPAWQRAWDTPGEALKIGEEIVEGVQDV